MRLTKASAERLKLDAGEHDKIFFDDDLPGFGLRLREGGKRTWIAQYRVGTKQRRLSIGTVATTSVEEARKRARSVLSKVHLGGDPQLERAEARAQASRTVQLLVERYITERATGRLKPRSLAEIQRHLRKHLSALSGMPVQKVTRADVSEQLAKVAKQNGPYAANRARAALSALFSWAIGEGLVETNPVIGTNKATDELARDRVLSPEELSVVWRAAGEGSYAAIVRLLILTGQRREEVGGMLWSELDLEAAVWRIGAERTKNGLAHHVPLSAPAIAILTALERREGRNLVFGAGSGPFQGWSNAKGTLNARALQRLRADGKGASFPPWRLHDLRRTVATRLVDLGVLPHVVEAILNHVSGHKAGVAGIYNRAGYAIEKHAALTLWGDHVSHLI